MLILFCTAALVLFLLSLDFGWSNVLTSRRNELVFETRNHEYGAYALRREHHANLFWSMLISCGLITGGVFLLSRITGAAPPVEADQSIILVELDPQPIETPESPKENPQPQNQAAAAAPEDDSNREIEVVEKPVEEDPNNEPPTTPVGPVQPGTPTPGGPSPGSGDGNGGGGQTSSEPIKVWDVVQSMPTFPGGEPALMKFIREHVEYDEYSKESKLEGTVYVSFVIQPTGEVDKVEIVRGIKGGERLHASVVETIRALPNWTPGFQNQRPVPVRRTIPVRFEIR
jgi:periplasmic protein TonB